MKKQKINIISFSKIFLNVAVKAAVATLGLTLMFCAFYWYNNTLFLWEAKFMWPQGSFSEIKFKSGTTGDRARMVVDLIQSKKIIGIDANKIPTILGKQTGDYYHSDSISTYRLTDEGRADWILTLVPGDDGKIEQIFIRKSCCSISKKMAYSGLDLADPPQIGG